MSTSNTDPSESLDMSLPSFRRWPITRLLGYREHGDNGQPEYHADWEPSRMNLEGLCTDFHGQPLLTQVLELQQDHVEPGVEPQYIVKWKQTWVTLEELSDCAYLVHDYWVHERRRSVSIFINQPNLLTLFTVVRNRRNGLVNEESRV